MSNSRVEEQFGPAAADYAACEIHAAGESLARMLKLAKPQMHWRAIDIATGAGHTAALFAPHVARIVATDITEQMLVETEKLKTNRDLKNLTTAYAQATQIPFSDNEFDLVTCRLAAHHFPDPKAFVAECARVLKPGGTFALVDNITPDAATLPDASESKINQTALDYNAFEKLRDPSHARALSTNEWTGIATEYGLAIRATEILTKEMEFGSWVERMRCSETTISKLHAILRGNTPLTTFLMPRETNDQLKLSLRELILIAQKAP